jgi:hypothetical protein
MGTEALSEVRRRDIRRAFSPEASAEVFRFVEHTEQALERAAVMLRSEIVQAEMTWAQALYDARHVFETMTFRQRLVWLLRGTWP